MPKTKLTIPEQIQDMTNKGITFKYNDNVHIPLQRETNSA